MNNNNLYAIVSGGGEYLSLVSYNNNSWTKELTLSEEYDKYKIFKYGTWYQDTYVALYRDRDTWGKFDIDIWNITSQSLIDSSNFSFEFPSDDDYDWESTEYSNFYNVLRNPKVKKNETHLMLDYKYNIMTFDGKSWSVVSLYRDLGEYFINSIPISNNWRIEMFSSYKVSLADQLKWPLIFVATIVVIILAVRYNRRPRQKQYDYVYFNEEIIWRER